ncbi:MAG: hypothetical protein WCK53_06985 [Methanomicrobiales archaeon]
MKTCVTYIATAEKTRPGYGLSRSGLPTKPLFNYHTGTLKMVCLYECQSSFRKFFAVSPFSIASREAVSSAFLMS